MRKQYSLMLDIFPHILPVKYKEALSKLPAFDAMYQRFPLTPALYDLDLRFRVMDKYDGLMQVLTLGSPPVEGIADSQKSVDLAKLANDEMAELISRHPDRFATAVACLPMNNIDAALKEADRAINDLKFRGVQIYTPCNDKPLDSPEFMPLYEKMSQYNLPIWIHPCRAADSADYRTEDKSLYSIFWSFGWVYETSAAMARLVFSGILERYPNLKFITHHCGAMVPYLEQRIIQQHAIVESSRVEKYEQRLTKAVIEYFKMFYADTALYGSTPGLMCGYAFFGAEHMLFGTDMPYDMQLGTRHVRQTINSIEQMDISDLEKKKIFGDNARSLLRLPI